MCWCDCSTNERAALFSSGRFFGFTKFSANFCNDGRDREVDEGKLKRGMRDFFGPSSVCGRKFYVDSESRSFFGSVSSSHLFDVFFYFSNQLIFKFRCRQNVFLAAPIVCLRHSLASYILVLMRARK